MLKLLARFARPYTGQLVAVVVLQLATVGAILFLPALNAEIIDDGIATGDTDVIWRLGGIMLAVALVQLAASISWCGSLPKRPCRSAETFARPSSGGCRSSPPTKCPNLGPQP